MKQLVTFISMFLLMPFLGAVDAVYPACMSLTPNGSRVYFSVGRPQKDVLITITPGMVEKTYVWANQTRYKTEQPLSLKDAQSSLSRGEAQAVEFHFYNPEESIKRVLRDPTSSESSHSQ